MPRFKKGSPEAMEWAKKMREARGKKVRGGGNKVSVAPAPAPTSSTEIGVGGKKPKTPPKTKAQKSGEVMPQTEATKIVSRGGYKSKGRGVAPPSRLPESPIPAEMVGGGAKKDFNKLTRGLAKAAKATQYANPMMWAIKDKDTSNLMAQSGDLAYNYLLPAIVETGRPVLDVATGAVSTALTGNPALGKAAGDLMWDEMVAKKGYDPRSRQKSEQLGEIGRLGGRFGSQQMKKKLGKGVAPPSRLPESSPAAEMVGGGMCKECPSCMGMGILSGGRTLALRDMPLDVFMETLKYMGVPQLEALLVAAGKEGLPQSHIDELKRRIRYLSPPSIDNSTLPVPPPPVRPRREVTIMPFENAYNPFLAGQGICGEGAGASTPNPMRRPYDEEKAKKMSETVFQYATKLLNVDNIPYIEVLDFLDAEIEQHKITGYKTEEMGYRMAKQMVKRYKEGI